MVVDVHTRSASDVFRRFLPPGAHLHKVSEDRIVVGCLRIQVQIDGSLLRSTVFILGNITFFTHAKEHYVAAVARRLLVSSGGIETGRLRKACEQRALLKAQIFERLGEVVLRAGLKAVSPATQEDLVAVHLHYLFFGVVALYLQREENLFDLSLVCLLRAEEQRAATVDDVEAPSALRRW